MRHAYVLAWADLKGRFSLNIASVYEKIFWHDQAIAVFESAILISNPEL